MEKCLWALEDFECKTSTFALKVKLYVPCAEKVNWKHGKFIKIQIKLLELKTTSGMKNTWNGINSRLDIAEEKISELKDSNWKPCKMKHRGQRKKNGQFISELQVAWCMCKWRTKQNRRERRKRTEKTIWRNNGWKLSKFTENYKLTHLSNSRNSKRNMKSYTKLHYNQVAQNQ